MVNQVRVQGVGTLRLPEGKQLNFLPRLTGNAQELPTTPRACSPADPTARICKLNQHWPILED
eukprot:4016853-Amphidinium_carterae.2